MSKYLFLLYGSVAFAGQSIQLSTATASNTSVAAQTVGKSWRAEFSIHNWDPNYSSNVTASSSAVGLIVYMFNNGGGDLRLEIIDGVADTGTRCTITGLGSGGPNGGGSIAANKFLTVRFQQDAVNKVHYCQAWDINGAMVWNEADAFPSFSGATSNGASVGSTGENMSTAYFRIYTSLLATNARPPVTTDALTSCLVFWKFDLGSNTGSLNDACSAGPYNASMSAGSPVYVPTPGQGLLVPVLKTMNAPAWTNTVSFRAGFPAQLDGNASYSQADGSANVSCLWQTLGGPSALIWDNQATCTATVQGLIFGDYEFQLAITDANGAHATASQHIGAVATDSNGVVVNADPNVDVLFGPMIALGKNPWGYQDYWTAHASALRLADYVSAYGTAGCNGCGWITGPSNKPQWEYSGQGTVSYWFNCIGIGGPGCNQTQYTGTISGSSVAVGATSFVVSTVTGLDLTTFPTHVIVYDGTGAEVRICSASGTTLNICYDGWGNNAAHTFAIGSGVLQAKVSGSGTKFLTDAVAPVCPVGAPGPPGPSLYSTGSITLTANSAAVVGSGTTFTTAMVGDYIRVPATHSSTAFIFVAIITGFTDTTHLTLGRVYPATADTTSGLAYDIMLANRTIVLRYPHAVDPTGTGQLMFGTSGGCESETELYLTPTAYGNSFAWYHDIPALSGVHFTGQTYSITDTNGWVSNSSAGGVSFYGESLAHRALYYRSGLTSALTAANYIADYWIKSPLANADGNGYPRLLLGGEGIGAFVSAILTGRVSWSDLRGYASMGRDMTNVFVVYGCAGADSRDSGYAYTWLILAAIYDPDTSNTDAPGGIPWRTYWQNALAQMKTNDDNCKNADNSFASAANLFGTNQSLLTLTNGSAAATGSGINSNQCYGTATGTATVTNGSNAITITGGSVPGGTVTLFLTGTSGGQPFIQNMPYGGGVLGALWYGDSGSINWMSESAQDMMTIGTGTYDPNLKKNWACVWNSSTSITLNRPWDGVTSDVNHVYYMYDGNVAGLPLVGYGQQPYMLGIRSFGQNLLASQTLPALSSYVAPYQTFAANSTTWIWNIGMDHQLLGTNYGRVYQQCEPTNTSPPGTSFTFRAPGCTYGADPTSVSISREQNAETSLAHGLYYQNNPTDPNKAFGDQLYGALWCATSYTIGGVYCDANSTANNLGVSNLLDNYIHIGKWTGFFTGMGMSHRWPAVRLGGVKPPSRRAVLISVRFADVASAASVNVLVTAPSGAQANFACSSEPCTITVDDRQGAHWYQIQYLSSGGTVLAQSQPNLLPLP